MAVKQFPADFPEITGSANKLIGAKLDGTTGYIIIPAGGQFLHNVPGADNKNVFITGSFGAYDNLFQYGAGSGKSLIKGFNTFNVNFGVGLAFFVNDSEAANNAIEVVTIHPNKNTGFGVPAPTQKVHVAGNILATGSITPGSDKRLKKNIKSLKNDVLALINKLRPVSYTLREDSATALGFIADEVRDLFPDLILEGKDDEKMLAMNYMGLTAPIVKAIQEMSATIELMKAEIAELKSK